MENKEKVTIVFEKNKNHIMAPITGAWGGLTPDQSSILINLFCDQPTLPSYQNINIAEDKSLDMEHSENVARGDITREVFGTFTMSSKTARAIASWLERYANELDKVK